ncbi:MAG: CbiX/SirB N-terminal domain-containing protein [Candidatus Brocadiales bacterium]|nr:CbiX/SirB N-terminal domain-containing protein [Candidatus Brocadiales bacterium]
MIMQYSSGRKEMVKLGWSFAVFLSSLFLIFLSASVSYGLEKEAQKKEVAKDAIRVQKIGQVLQKEEPKTTGVIVLAHGMHAGHGSLKKSSWEDSVLEAVKPLKGLYPLEVAFGMAEPDAIKEAVLKLEEKGVSEIVVVPLFISSHSPIIGNSRYILGLQEELPRTTSIKSLPKVESKARFYMTAAMDDSILIAEILLERAMELSNNPVKETVILVGHGPNDDEENRLWLENMERLAYYVREKGTFREAMVATLRIDAPKEVKQEAINKLRTLVETYGKEGSVIIVPHLLAPGVEEEIVEALRGLAYVYNGKTLLPHVNITKWIEMQVEQGLMKLQERQG